LTKGKPLGDKVRITMSLDVELWKKLKYLSIEERKPLNQIVVEALKEKLEKAGRI
jgi:hypothetical protein